MTGAEIVAALEGLSAVLTFINKRIEEGRERGEWSSAEEKAFDEKQKQITAQAHWLKK